MACWLGDEIKYSSDTRKTGTHLLERGVRVAHAEPEQVQMEFRMVEQGVAPRGD